VTAIRAKLYAEERDLHNQVQQQAAASQVRFADPQAATEAAVQSAMDTADVEDNVEVSACG
jgi:hypothetical protein